MRAKALARFTMIAALGAAALAVAPAAASAQPVLAHPDFSQATGSESPAVVRPGGKVDLGLDCVSTSDSAAATGTEVGLASNIAMHKNGDELFGLSVTVPKTVKSGTYHVSLQCADGSFTTVQFAVAANGGSGS